MKRAIPVYHAYAKDVVDGKIAACRHVVSACRRSLEDWKNQKKKAFPWTYDQEWADLVIDFIESLPYPDGHKRFKREDGTWNTIDLEPWQKYLVSEIYAWRSKEDPYKRRFETVILEVPRKNAKTTLVGAICLYELMTAEDAAQLHTVATTMDQAKLCWTAARRMITNMDLPEARLVNVLASKSIMEYDENVFQSLASQTKSLDGLNSNVVVIDEAACIDDAGGKDTIGTVITGQGARHNPLAFFLTTAQVWKGTKYLEYRKHMLTVLDKVTTDDKIFGLLYGIDKDDKVEDESTWFKANPNLDVSVTLNSLRKSYTPAKNSPIQMTVFKRKHLNIWGGSGDQWMDLAVWQKGNQPEPPEELEKTRLYIGVDSSGFNDLTAVCYLHQFTPTAFWADFRCYCTDDRYESLSDELKVIYEHAYTKEMVLQKHEAAVIDHDQVLADILAYAKGYEFVRAGADPMWSQSIMDGIDNAYQNQDKVTTIGGMANKQHPGIHEAAKYLTAGYVTHPDYNFIDWQFDNTGLIVNPNTKLSRLDKQYGQVHKIDAIQAFVNAVNCSREKDKPESNYEFVSINLKTGETKEFG